jgi:hypothetical protein
LYSPRDNEFLAGKDIITGGNHILVLDKDGCVTLLGKLETCSIQNHYTGRLLLVKPKPKFTMMKSAQIKTL